MFKIKMMLTELTVNSTIAKSSKQTTLHLINSAGVLAAY